MRIDIISWQRRLQLQDCCDIIRNSGINFNWEQKRFNLCFVVSNLKLKQKAHKLARKEKQETGAKYVPETE